MLKKIPLAVQGIFALMLAVFLVIGCSSTEITGPQTSDNAIDGVSKITVTTDYDNAYPETNIEFQLARAGHVYFEITNATGYHVRTLIDDEMEAGAYQVVWDGTNDDGEQINSGIYLFHIITSDYEAWQASPVGIQVDGRGEES